MQKPVKKEADYTKGVFFFIQIHVVLVRDNRMFSVDMIVLIVIKRDNLCLQDTSEGTPS